MINIAIFASGSGSNAENIVNYFKNNEQISVKTIISNNADAYVLQRAKNLGVEARVFSKEEFSNCENILAHLALRKIKYIILAGFILKIPEMLIKEYPNQIINIHPSLLPRFGGKGMYGNNVHKAVIEAGETESGITIHIVNEEYDKGRIIFQAKTDINPKIDNYEDVAEKVHHLEYTYFPQIIEQIICDN